MEHRYSPRVSADLKILIYECGVPVAIGHLGNLSRHGLFVQSDCASIVVNQSLEIELLLRSAATPERARCKVMVMHKSAGGFGVAVDESCEASRKMVSILADRFRYAENWSRFNKIEVNNTQRAVGLR